MGDGYTAAEMEKWHADARRLAGILFASSPFKERRKRLQRLGRRRAVGGERRRAASDGVFRTLRRCARPTTRFGSERYVLQLRQQAAARGRGGGALRVHRDRGQRPQVRRRRHPQPLRDRVGRQRVHAVRVRARVRPPLRRAWPTSTTRPTSRYESTARASGALGAERDGGSEGVEVEGPRPIGNAAAHAMGEGGVRGVAAQRARPDAGRSAPTSGRRPRWRRSSRKRARR